MTNQSFLILHADDLGFTHGFNEAIKIAHQQGSLTSTCLQVTGFAYREAVRDVLPACPDLGVGIHLNLVECRSILDHRLIPALTKPDGSFRGYGPLLRAVWNRSIRRQIRDECRAQIEKALDDGVSLDHVNSHRHAHMLPGFFEIACELAAEYEIGFVRIVEERFHRPRPLRGGRYLLRDANWAKMLLMNRLARRNRPKLAGFGLRANDAFAGLSYTAYGSSNALHAAIEANRHCESHSGKWIIEALVHLCIAKHPNDAQSLLPPSVRRYCDSPWRMKELESTLCDPAHFAGGDGWTFASYRDLSTAVPSTEQARRLDLDVIRQYAV